jgi:hypothetical protein
VARQGPVIVRWKVRDSSATKFLVRITDGCGSLQSDQLVNLTAVRFLNQ